MAQTKAEKNRVIERWQRENVVRITVKLNKHTDADILDKLETVKSKQGYIKALVRADINK